MPRLFIGLEIPAEVRAELARLRGGISGARWIEPENYHITLRFIGDIDRRGANDVADELSQVARPAFDIAFDAVSWFGADRPRAIVVRVKLCAALVDLQAEMERRLRRIGLEAETRNFSPHVTLARLRAISPLAVAGYLQARGALAVRPFAASRFVLFSARALTGGGPYRVEAAYELQLKGRRK